MGALELSTLEGCASEWPHEAISKLEYRGMVLLSALYLGLEFIFSACQKGIANCQIPTYSPNEQQHTGIMLVLGAAGILGLTMSSRYGNSNNHYPMTVFSLLYGLFIAQHEQPNKIGIYIHMGTGFFIALYGIVKAADQRHSAGASILVAGNLFYYGQYGMVAHADSKQVHPVGYLLGVSAMSLIWVCAYVLSFPASYRDETPIPAPKQILDFEVSLCVQDGENSCFLNGGDCETEK